MTWLSGRTAGGRETSTECLRPWTQSVPRRARKTNAQRRSGRRRHSGRHSAKATTVSPSTVTLAHSPSLGGEVGPQPVAGGGPEGIQCDERGPVGVQRPDDDEGGARDRGHEPAPQERI